jgi:hypothetical protein
MRVDLRLAIKSGDRTSAAALRSALAAFDNAEAVEGGSPDISRDGSEHVAGAVHGLGAAERQRRALSEQDMTSIVLAEREQHLGAAAQARAAGRDEIAHRHIQQADVLESYLGTLSDGT